MSHDIPFRAPSSPDSFMVLAISPEAARLAKLCELLTPEDMKLISDMVAMRFAAKDRNGGDHE